MLLEFREWPCSPPPPVLPPLVVIVVPAPAAAAACNDCASNCWCWLPLPSIALVGVSVSINEYDADSEFSDIPESVTMEDANDNGSISDACKSFFFLVNDPNPDEPDADDESSRILLAVPLERAVGGRPINGVATGGPPDTLPILSWDVIFLLFKLDEGLLKN